MINRTDHYVAWALLIDELDEAREHLSNLTEQMARDGRIDESEYAAHLGHVFAHLNRAWNGRDFSGDATDGQREAMSLYPSDLTPIG
ncbi:MAG: hypothetical protein JSR73_01645 [Proteobacteria bacterium]|nr:hypothetical protein [Pseudomonadota bacterium]